MARELTTDQQAILAATLPESGKVELLVDTTISAAEEFAGKFAGVFAEKGWEVVTTGFDRPGGSSPTGLMFLSQADLPLSEVQATFVSALEAAEVPFNRLDAMMQEGVDIRLMFGRVGA